MSVRNIAALDVGEKRIGVATANAQARLASPLMTLENNAEFTTKLAKLVETEKIDILVVGLPRGMEGQETEQTRFARSFANRLKSDLSVPVHLQDEAGTSVKAEEELKSKKKPYTKGDIDSLAATYILQDYLDLNASKLSEKVTT